MYTYSMQTASSDVICFYGDMGRVNVGAGKGDTNHHLLQKQHTQNTQPMATNALYDKKTCIQLKTNTKSGESRNLGHLRVQVGRGVSVRVEVFALLPALALAEVALVRGLQC